MRAVVNKMLSKYFSLLKVDSLTKKLLRRIYVHLGRKIFYESNLF